MAGRIWIRIGISLTMAAAYLALALPAEGSFPGRNGVIAFVDEGPPFSPRGVGASTIRVVDPASGRMRQLTRVSRRCRERGWTWEDGQPSYSASGRLLAYHHADACDPRIADGLYVMRADGSRRRLIRRETADDDDLPEFPALSPTGGRLAFDQYLSDTYVMRLERGAEERSLRRCPRTRCPLSRYSEVAQPAWNPAGTRLALTLSGIFGEGDVGHIGTVNRRGVGLRLVTRSRLDAMPDWSPTGDRIAFHRERFFRGRFEGNIWTAPAHPRRHGRPRRLTHTRDAYFPAWSPNRRDIAYVRNPDAFLGPASLWIMRASDGGRQRLLVSRVVTDRISWRPRLRR